MSKMDALRAMREAKYERAAAAAPKAKRPPAAPPVAPPVAKPVAKQADPAPAGTEPALCGHRNMGGRTCTREHGHAAKSHRYS